jgi:hypothetical protein
MKAQPASYTLCFLTKKQRNMFKNMHPVKVLECTGGKIVQHENENQQACLH